MLGSLLLGAFFLVCMVGLTAFLVAKYSEHQAFRKRINAIASSNKGFNAGGKDDGVSSGYRKKKIQDKLKQIEKNKKNKDKNSITAQLKQAGFNATLLHFWLYSFLFGFGVSFFWFVFKGKGLMLIVVFLFATFIYPRRYLKKKVKKRQAAFVSGFADAIDIIVRGIRSGLPVGECIKMIGREMPDPVGQEFRLIVEGQKIGLTTSEIMDRALERMPIDDFKFFSVVLIIQQQTGGNLAETLDKLSNVLRGRKKMKDKVQALSSEAKTSAMIIGSLPFCLSVILSLVAPEYIGQLFEDPIGHFMIAAGLTWMGMGVLFMKNMINFDF